MYQNIIDLIEHAGDAYGYRTFSVDPEGRLSFRELQERAETAGETIRKILRPEKPGFAVAIYGEKSNQLLTAMMSAVCAGAFYVVLNPEQPMERLNQILEVLKPELLICEDDLSGQADMLAFSGRKITYQELFSLKTTESASSVSPAFKEDVDPLRPDRNAPLYGIFTSGSTGTPKCVLISHGDVLDFIGHFAEAFHFSEEDVIGNQAPFDFDVSVKDIYTALMTGASLLLIPREYFSTPPRLLDYICDHGVTSLTWAVSALCIISGLKGFSYRVPSGLKRVMFSGEVMPLKQLRIWQKYIPDAQYVNLYGPTEITCNCMYYVIPSPYAGDRPLPLGVPFPGREVTLRDEEGRILTEPGSRGELWVAGESLAIGYYRNPEETEKHFITESEMNPKRIYRTGDMAEIGEDGQLYFSGRRDFQIKHMGHRIELEEIEKDVESEPGIDRCICSFDEKKKRITAFYTGSVEKHELHVELKEKLPLYMIPNRFTHVKAFLLNKNGKVDRKKLELLEIAE